MITTPLILLSVPGLREKDLANMPNLQKMTAGGDRAELTPSFPCVTCPVQANMSVGLLPEAHGVVGNGFYWRDQKRVEMWTASNDCVERPQLWDLLSHHEGGLTSAVWFPLHSKHCEADFVCTPAPIHNPDGSESLWCYTRPSELYGELRDAFGHFPLQNYWGPMTSVKASQWIADSAVFAVKRWQPHFFYIYLPHLDYAAQRMGPDSEAAGKAVAELDDLLGRFAVEMEEAYDCRPQWLVVGEYAINDVDHVAYPNRILREAGLLKVREEDGGELIDFEASEAFALVDHQFSHIFVQEGSETIVEKVADLFRSREGFAEVLCGLERARYGMDHERSGEIILISAANSWQAYYYWNDDAKAPRFARTVDIHRKPGYDPVELFFDMATKSIPLNAALVKGSHGAPAEAAWQKTVALSSPGLKFPQEKIKDVDIFRVVTGHFGLNIR